jgi:hypothetical protein
MHAPILAGQIGERRPFTALEVLDLAEKEFVVASARHGHDRALEHGGCGFDHGRAPQTFPDRHVLKPMFKGPRQRAQKRALVLLKDAHGEG